MRVDVRDKVVVVTGAARGLGAAIAGALVHEGARVAVLTRSRDRSERVARDLAARHPDRTPPLPSAPTRRPSGPRPAPWTSTAPLMIRGGGGRIVCLSSIIGVQANAGPAAYGASKTAGSAPWLWRPG
jgi:NAD(P)-dependent dehydrogenase (short-subunit alcohol dehydrogenase family)